jgi:hypothetical protein
MNKSEVGAMVLKMSEVRSNIPKQDPNFIITSSFSSINISCGDLCDGDVSIYELDVA